MSKVEEECQGFELAYKVVTGKTYFVKLNAKTEEEAVTAFELVQQLDGMIGDDRDPWSMIVWTPGKGAKLYTDLQVYDPHGQGS